jgi:hypothetical protein
MEVAGEGDGPVAYGGLARELNGRIREIGGERGRASDAPFDFFCLCGCFETLRMTVAEYDSVGGEVLIGDHTAKQDEPDRRSTSADAENSEE